ncbi:MAG: hypothetical protein JWQ89_2710 [Devosia sp.]|uniref:hypothetical protein n=1 Tax=Devosia sp. TaxID=1871048 RepID=UPI00262E80D1|nr:hypothetical protein [Devosia sp.]MDB5540983.1 hypothetical protein [Devosia sp.]
MEAAAVPSSLVEALPHFSIIDSSTVLVAIFVVVFKMLVRWHRGETIASVQMCGVDFLNGTVVVPFFVMLLAVFYVDLYREMVRSSTAFVSIAGGIGLFFVIGEMLRSQGKVTATT